MPLADDVLAELKANKGNPEFVHLSDEMLALCAVLDRKPSRIIHGPGQITVAAPAYADGAVDDRYTAKPRR